MSKSLKKYENVLNFFQLYNLLAQTMSVTLSSEKKMCTSAGHFFLQSLDLSNHRTPVQIDRTPVQIDRTPVQIDRTPVQIDRAPVQIDRAPVIKKVLKKGLKLWISFTSQLNFLKIELEILYKQKGSFF